MENFNIDSTSLNLEHLETLDGHKLYAYGHIAIIVKSGVGDITKDKVVATFKEIRGKLLHPDKAAELINIITFEDGRYTWSTGRYDPFDRIRRITGYLVGTMDRFNNAKRSEENDRVKHTLE